MGRQRKAITVGVLVVSVALLARAGVAVGRPLATQAASNRQLAALVSQERGLITSGDTGRDSAVARLGVELDDRLLDASTRVQAEAELASEMEEMADEAGLVVQRLAPTALADTTAPLERVAIQFEGAGDHEAVASLLQSIAVQPRLMSIERFGLRASRTSPELPFTVSLVVRGLFKPQSGNKP